MKLHCWPCYLYLEPTQCCKDHHSCMCCDLTCSLQRQKVDCLAVICEKGWVFLRSHNLARIGKGALLSDVGLTCSIRLTWICQYILQFHKQLIFFSLATLLSRDPEPCIILPYLHLNLKDSVDVKTEGPGTHFSYCAFQTQVKFQI